LGIGIGDWAQSPIPNKQNSKDYKKLKFDDVLYNYFYNQYFYAKEGFPESSEFEFANTLYRYIKLISIPPYEFDEARNLIQKIHEIKESVIIHEMSNILNNNEGACSQGQNISTSHKSHIAHKFDLTAQKEKSFELNFLEHYFIIKFFEKITQTVEVYTKGSTKFHRNIHRDAEYSFLIRRHKKRIFKNS
jgi:hypothetical protein